MKKQNYNDIETAVEEKKIKREKKKSNQMRVSGKNVLKLADIIKKRRKSEKIQ